MQEGECSFDIRFHSDCRCEFRLCVDVPDAKYRRKRDGSPMSKMCDFAAAGAHGNQLRLLVVELKAGAAKWAAVKQLQEGLSLLYEYLPESTERTCPAAYLVVGKRAAHMKHLLRSRSTHLRFGEFLVQPQVRDCGKGMAI